MRPRREFNGAGLRDRERTDMAGPSWLAAALAAVMIATAIYCASAADCGAGSCDLVNNECTLKTCGSNADCPVCQTCTAAGNTKCEALHDGDAGPPALSICIGSGI